MRLYTVTSPDFLCCHLLLLHYLQVSLKVVKRLLYLLCSYFLTFSQFKLSLYYTFMLARFRLSYNLLSNLLNKTLTIKLVVSVQCDNNVPYYLYPQLAAKNRLPRYITGVVISVPHWTVM